MVPVGVGNPRSGDRRGQHRVRLTVPVHFSGESELRWEGLYPETGQSRDVSADGLYVVATEGRPVKPGELLRVSLSIPREAQRHVPLSRIVGLCRVLRVERVPAEQGGGTGIALAFCGEQVSMFGTI